MDLALFQQGQQGRSIAVGRGHALPPSSVSLSNAAIASPASASVAGNHHLPGIGGGGGGTGALGGLDFRGIVSHDADATMAESHESGPQKKKQKRNKPTLSCHECVERKTKVSERATLAGSETDGQPITFVSVPCLSVWSLYLLHPPESLTRFLLHGFLASSYQTML